MSADGATILLVEDDQDHVELISRGFEDHAPRLVLVTARSLAEARASLALHHVDLVISDLRLPDGEGTELLQSCGDRIPLVVLTSHGSEKSAVTAMKAGALDYVVKTPDTFADMPHVAERALREWRHIRQRERAELEKAEKDLELRRQRDFAEGLIHTAQAVVLVLDQEARVVRFNPYVETLTGRALAEVVGRGWFEVFVPEHERGLVEERFHDVLSGVPVRGFVSSVLLPRGGVAHIEWSASRLEDEAGNVVGVLGIGLDVSERVAAQRERERLREQLLEHERLAAIGTAAAMLAHEIANPLNNMFLHAQLLERRMARQTEPNDPRLRAGVGSIVGEIRRLNRLLEEFRALARKQKLALAPVQLADLVRDVCESEAPTLEEHGVVITRALPEDLPPVLIDREKVKQVLLNLCKNAVEAMGAGGGSLFVEVELEASGAAVRLAVRDSGCGIPAGVDVFEPFLTTKEAGTGLGLAIVRQILEAHGGSIHYVSEVGVGTTFYCSFPVAGAAGPHSERN